MLVELHMPNSQLKKLWVDEDQDLVNLKIINLFGSKDLIEVPDLSLATKLERVNLSGCESLRQLHPSILSLPKLTHLNLSQCKKIESLKTNIHSKSLCELHLNGCSSLTEFSVTSEEITMMSLSGTAIHELSSSIWCNSKLAHLDLTDCNYLNTIGNKLSNDPGLGSLRGLNFTRCSQINASNLWCILDGIQSLKRLELGECCNLEAIPINIQNHSMLENLWIWDCEKLVCLPAEFPPSLQVLQVVNCASLDTQGPVLENMLKSMSYIQPHDHEDEDGQRFLDAFFCVPGAQVPGMLGLYTTEASITIPPIPKSDLCCFIFCFILSEGTIFKDSFLDCFIYEHGKKVDSSHLEIYYDLPFISDHVLLWWYGYDIQESRGNHNSQSSSFEFKYEHYQYSIKEDKKWPMDKDEIKGWGILPVYASELGLDLANAQISYQSVQHLEMDFDHLRANGGEIGISNKENEDDHQEQLLIPANMRRRT